MDVIDRTGSRPRAALPPAHLPPACLLPLLLPTVLACKAESLGVEVPRGGVDTISQEDLQRDVFQLVSLERDGATRGPGAPNAEEAARRITFRLQQMHTLPAFGADWRQVVGPEGAGGGAGDWNLCGIREGRSPTTTLVLALDAGAGAGAGAAPVAALLSLAKGGDTAGRRPRTEVFCRVAPGEGLSTLVSRPPVPWDRVDRVLVLGPLGGASLEESPFDGLPRSATRATAPPEPATADTVDGMERIDWRVTATQVRDLFVRHLGT